jgi:hypothetical protein
MVLSEATILLICYTIDNNGKIHQPNEVSYQFFYPNKIAPSISFSANRYSI